MKLFMLLLYNQILLFICNVLIFFLLKLQSDIWNQILLQSDAVNVFSEIWMWDVMFFFPEIRTRISQLVEGYISLMGFVTESTWWIVYEADMALGLILAIGRSYRRKRTSSLNILTSKTGPRDYYKGKNCKPTGFYTRQGFFFLQIIF